MVSVLRSSLFVSLFASLFVILFCRCQTASLLVSLLVSLFSSLLVSCVVRLRAMLLAWRWSVSSASLFLLNLQYHSCNMFAKVSIF